MIEVSKRWKFWMLWFYIAMAISTFGYAANKRWQFEMQACVGDKVPTQCYGPPPGFWGLMAGIGWPLYLSWELQS